MQVNVKAPYWITKNDFEGVAIGLKRSLNKWRIYAIQYFRTDPTDAWEAVSKGITLNKSLYPELANAALKLRENLEEPGHIANIRKSSLEELRISVRQIGQQYYFNLRSFVRERDGGQETWLPLEEEISVPSVKYNEFVAVVNQLGKSLEIIRMEDSKPSSFTKPKGRKQYYIDERGFLISKEDWDEARA